MLVNKELYVFSKGNPVSTYKIADITTSTDCLKKTTLSTLPRNEYLRYFHACYWAVGGSIVLTGGESDGVHVQSAKTYMMAVQTNEWQQKSFPDLNKARHWHKSLGLGEQVYVTCGVDQNDKMFSSCEMLRLGADLWEIIDIPDLTPRVLPVFAQISPEKICILGGMDE